MILRGYASMVGELAGSQWNRGGVFCSVVRRVALPDSFFAIDGLLETFLTVLDEFGAFPAVDRGGTRSVPAVPGDHQGVDGCGTPALVARPPTEAIKARRGGCAGHEAGCDRRRRRVLLERLGAG